MLLTIWRRLTGGDRRVRAQPDWELFAGPDWADDIMSIPATDRLHQKQGRSIGRLFLRRRDNPDDRLVVYLKRHFQLPRLRGLLAVLFPSSSWSPGFEEWDNLERMEAEGVPVPRPVAAGQFLMPGGRLQGFLAVEELTGMVALHEAIPLAKQRLGAQAFSQWKCGLVAAMAGLSRSLHDRAYFHKDLYLCHFYIDEADTFRVPASWKGRLIIIDLHRLGKHRLTWIWWLAKDLGQLLYSSEVDGVTTRDRARFWRLYFGEKRGGLVARWLRWMVLTRAWNYRGRNEKRPRGVKVA